VTVGLPVEIVTLAPASLRIRAQEHPHRTNTGVKPDRQRAPCLSWKQRNGRSPIPAIVTARSFTGAIAADTAYELSKL
jgi:hypothetical protein